MTSLELLEHGDRAATPVLPHVMGRLPRFVYPPHAALVHGQASSELYLRTRRTRCRPAVP